MSQTIPGPDGKPRCRWCAAAPEFFAYHDTEWGFPVDDDRRLFEKLCLESFQSGLSWRTILAKRENFRAAFCNFDAKKIAGFAEVDVRRLLQDEGIVRHRGKIEAVINNAARMLELVEREGSLAAYVWRFEPTVSELAKPQTVSTSAASIALSRISGSGAGNSSAQPPSTPLCRPWDWSTTTSKAAPYARRSNAHATHSRAQEAEPRGGRQNETLDDQHDLLGKLPNG